MKDNLVIIHGGGPTAVLNCSLYGAIREAQQSGAVEHVYGAIGGTGGLLRENLLDFGTVPEEELERLPRTPATAIGTSRDALEAEDYARMADILAEKHIRYVLMNGGNGTMDACGKLAAACRGRGISVMGIPKTMDNDIAVTDHAPGFASAARYMAATTSAICCDVRGLPIHIVIVEAMGRNAGWVTASSCFADESGTGGPDLIYLPERAFDERAFLDDAQRLIDEKGSGVVVVSEGLHTADGTPVAPPLMTVGRATYFGDVSAHLAKLVISELGYKARSEKPGLIGRASIAWQSPVDREEAIGCGREATRAVLEGDSGKMVGIERVSTEPYEARLIRIPIEQVMLDERTMPDEYINERGNGVTDAFRTWCRPLLGPALPRFASFA